MTEKHIVFGSGPTGRATAEELLAKGKDVTIVNRSGKMPDAPADVKLVAADLYDAARVREVCNGAVAAYQCAQPRYFEWVEKFPPLQQSIIDGLTGSGAKLVLVENLYMYGETGGKPMTESTAHNAHTRKGRVRSEMSKAAFAAHEAGKLRVTSARGSDFFGPWVEGSAMGDRVFAPLLAGKKAQATGKLDQPHSFTYIRDFARTLVALAENDAADGKAWHVPNDQPRITQKEFITIIAEEAGVAAKMSAMGKLMMWIGGLFIPEAKETVEMMYEFDQPFIVDASAVEETFGIKATPLRDAVRETVAWYKAHAKE